MQVDRVWTGARLATLAPARPGLGVIEDGVIAARDGRIAWVGARAEAPTFEAAETIALDGRWITPGLVDCHTHLVYGGNRAHEFELRLAGATYEEIARAGGGILSTVKATRAASEDDLVRAALPRLDALLGEGVTTVEIKSGYGLELETEARQLRAARRLGVERRVSVTTTFLGAHAMPPEAEDKDTYIARLCNQMLPAIAQEGLADAVDAFMENIAFSGAQTARVFEVAKRLGLPVKLHADQLSNDGGANLAARYSALSADHLEHTDAAGAAALAKSGTVAVLLPGAYYFIRETQKPPVAEFRAHKVRRVVGTSGTMLLVDRAGRPTGPVRMYNDGSGAAHAGRIREVAPLESGAHGATSPLAWLMVHAAECKGAVHAVHQADWLLGRLCGRHGISDDNNALKTGWDPVGRHWPEWIESLGVHRSVLPGVVEPGNTSAIAGDVLISPP